MLIKVGTRASLLALTQTQIVISEIQRHYPSINFEIVKIKTTGDKLYDANLALIGGKGLFLKEIEEQLIAGSIDIAVHSMKDATIDSHNRLIIDCVLKREDAADAFISDKYNSVYDLPLGATIGSSSSRRKAILLNMKPDLNIIQFRGNVDTRISKMKSGEVDATILAHAGLKRLNLTHVIKHTFSIDEMLPAVAQGVIGVERRVDDLNMANILAKINHNDTYLCITAERSFLYHMNANCTTPIAAYAIILHNQIHLKAQYMINSQIYKTESFGSLESADSIGQIAAQNIKNML